MTITELPKTHRVAKRTAFWGDLKHGVEIVLALGLIFGATAQAADALKPNIVVFISDDHGRLDSTPYGATDVQTPNVARLAREGMLFTHCFVASPSCAPSRAAMLTGLMPARNGAEANHTYKREGIRSLPDTLREIGYETAAFGKVAHGAADTPRHGFDRYDQQNGSAFVEKFLSERDATKPLCMFVGIHEPHVPWLALNGYDPAKVTIPQGQVDTPETRDFRAHYYTSVTIADTKLGEIYDLARKHFDPRNTVLIYTSDNGVQWPFGKWDLYDAGIRVPFLAVWPGVIRPGTRCAAMIQWIDLLPTLIEAAGGKAPEGIDGRSFLPVLRGEQSEHRDIIFATHSADSKVNVYPIRAVRTRDWKLILNLHPEYAHTTHIDKAPARTSGLGYWVSWYQKAKIDPVAAGIVKRYYERPAVELYDLRNDLFEEHNLADRVEQAGRVKQMRAQLEAWMKEQGDQQTVFNTPWLLSDPISTQPTQEAPPDTTSKKQKNQP
jgi:N-sulfoglucosamine sulfohydrolase